MTLPPEKRLRFFVYVIESPAAVDFCHQRSEGKIIQDAANLNQIPCIIRTAINFEAFEAALKIGLKEAMDNHTGLIPILHISAHGFSDGIQLSDGQIISWFLLESLIRPINQALNHSLLLCLSCCEGYCGIRMAMTSDNRDHPFYALISNGEKPSWSDTAVAYSTFYHLIAKGHFIIDAVNAMQIASGNDNFWISTAEDAKNGYLEYVKNISTEQVQQQLEINTRDETPEHLAKLVKLNSLN